MTGGAATVGAACGTPCCNRTTSPATRWMLSLTRPTSWRMPDRASAKPRSTTRSCSFKPVVSRANNSATSAAAAIASAWGGGAGGCIATGSGTAVSWGIGACVSDSACRRKICSCRYWSAEKRFGQYKHFLEDRSPLLPLTLSPERLLLLRVWREVESHRAFGLPMAFSCADCTRTLSINACSICWEDEHMALKNSKFSCASCRTLTRFSSLVLLTSSSVSLENVRLSM
mmetsp:Transcript_9183/g.26401  ORF Transcript_9183/g.26401 Transcript_9183/m.26401 type:complete len:229 (-) Transcript_9183:270-956(-)